MVYEREAAKQREYAEREAIDVESIGEFSGKEASEMQQADSAYLFQPRNSDEADPDEMVEQEGLEHLEDDEEDENNQVMDPYVKKRAQK